MKRLRHNLLRERITTIIGVVIFVATLTSVFVVQGITWGDAWIPMAISLLLMLMPDRALGIVRRVADRKQQDVSNLVGLLALGLLLGLSACTVRRQLEEVVHLPARPVTLTVADTSQLSRTDSATAPAPALTPAQQRRHLRTVAAVNRRQRRFNARQFRREQRQYDRSIPRKIKAGGSVSLNTAPHGTATTAPAKLKVSGSGTVATAPSSAATNNAGLGQKAAGGVNTAPAGHATGATAPPGAPWLKYLLYGAALGLILAWLIKQLIRWLRARITFAF